MWKSFDRKYGLKNELEHSWEGFISCTERDKATRYLPRIVLLTKQSILLSILQMVQGYMKQDSRSPCGWSSCFNSKTPKKGDTKSVREDSRSFTVRIPVELRMYWFAYFSEDSKLLGAET